MENGRWKGGEREGEGWGSGKKEGEDPSLPQCLKCVAAHGHIIS